MEKKKYKLYNFISAVLHGTTKTHSDYLKRSTSGCHKVNVAGDFLDTFTNLFLPIFIKFIKFSLEIKKSLFLLYPYLKKLRNINEKGLFMLWKVIVIQYKKILIHPNFLIMIFPTLNTDLTSIQKAKQKKLLIRYLKDSQKKL